MPSFPYLSDILRALTGIDLPLPFATFGLLVAIAMLAAAACFRSELRRLHAAGRIGNGRKPVKHDGQRAVTELPPHELVTDLVFVVMIAGVVGARVFHILEHLDSFRAAPWDMIFSRSGLSVFGGLIFGTAAGIVCVRRWRLPARPLLDAVAPAMMLGYAIGRVGCQLSGDGDWGVPAAMAAKPVWLPTWMWAQTYEHNIYGVTIAAPGVYPTPMYETVIALACFALLWALRKQPFKTGWLFSLYLLLAGVERFLIEQIRVNPVLDFGLFRATQAEMIAGAMIFSGLAGLLVLGRYRPAGQRAAA
jgi:phosphatidylglycerol:prolipoprotein diacylglycerol transferase